MRGRSSLAAPKPGADFAAEQHPAVGVDRSSKVYAWGLDYAWGYHAGFPQTLVANGAQFVVRYLNDPGGKGVTFSEARALQESGITVALVWEGTGTDFTAGSGAGVSDGQQAAGVARGLGAPAGTYIWFAIDTGTSDFADTNAYLRGAKQGTGGYVAQLYGSYDVVEAAAKAGLGNQQWQTYAWSAGKLSTNAALYQYQNGVMVGGVSCDRDQALQPVRGSWMSFGAPTPPPPQPLVPAFPWASTDYIGVQSTDPHCRSGFLAADQPPIELWQKKMAARGWRLDQDGTYGNLSQTACRLFQAEKGLAVDGKVGPNTWAMTWTAPVT